MSAIIIGIICGFIVSAGVGPLNILAMQKSLKEGFLSGLMIGIGVAFMDMLYAAAASFGLSPIFEYQIFKLIFQLIGIPLVIYLGIKSFHYSPLIMNGKGAPVNVKYHNSILIGISIYLANPTFLPLWVGLVGVITARQLMGNSNFENLIFSVGVLVGTFLWFYILLKFLLKWQILTKPSVVKGISYVSGVMLLGFGIYMISHLIIDIVNKAEYLKGVLF